MKIWFWKWDFRDNNEIDSSTKEKLNILAENIQMRNSIEDNKEMCK